MLIVKPQESTKDLGWPQYCTVLPVTSTALSVSTSFPIALHNY